MSRIKEIRARLRRLPVLYATCDGPEWRCEWPGGGPAVWTVSANPEAIGWRTDSGCCGYGLPQQVAEDIAAMRNDVKWLLSELERTTRKAQA